jgi:hypothetical protein
MSPLLILAAAPLVALSLALLIFSAMDLARRPASGVVGGNKIVWVVVLLFGTIGPIAYLFLGRQEPPVDES